MCFDASRTAAGWSSLTTPETGGNTPLRVPKRPESQTPSIPRGGRVAAGGWLALPRRATAFLLRQETV